MAPPCRAPQARAGLMPRPGNLRDTAHLHTGVGLANGLTDKVCRPPGPGYTYPRCSAILRQSHPTGMVSQ